VGEIGSASSELMRSMTMRTPVELTGLACGVGRGDASVLLLLLSSSSLPRTLVS